MGRSFIGVGERGFRTADGLLEIVAAMLVNEIRIVTDAPAWLVTLQDSLAEKIGRMGPGMMTIDFARSVGDDPRRLMRLSEIVQTMRGRVRARGDVLEPAEIHSLLGAFGQLSGTWTQPVSVKQLDRLLSALLAVLRGEDLVGIQDMYIV